MCLALLLVGVFIRGVVRLVKESKVLNLPLVEQQSIVLPEAGTLVLCEEGPRFSRRFVGLTYELSTEYGVPVAGRIAWFHARTSGVSTVRTEVSVYEIPHPGRFVLRVKQLGAPQERDAQHRLAFLKPHLGKSVVHVIGITLSSCLFIASLVFFLLRLTGNIGEPSIEP